MTCQISQCDHNSVFVIVYGVFFCLEVLGKEEFSMSTFFFFSEWLLLNQQPYY